MPETREIVTYNSKGKVVERVPYEVSDEELELEGLDKDIQSYIETGRAALKDWSTLTAAQKYEALKFVLLFVIRELKNR